MVLSGFMIFFSSLVIYVWTLSIISGDYMPLQPLEDEDDTVINFLYPLEPPVRFLIYFSEEYYLIGANWNGRFELFEVSLYCVKLQ